ncbi:MAG: hypothetical protein BWY46_00069 [Firmicutes bacterium ADurb.Bin300]|nr:MAG: hypothetical protein BWY46_00069 [Firmicutes bacterium ADurb.Bin300]HOD02411.1 YicC family protein [Clostridiales bacterium]
MVKSMTGFGSFAGTIDEYSVSVEIKSVNHRYFEFSLRIPKLYSSFEDRIKKLISAKVERGKVDCFIQLEAPQCENVKVTANKVLARRFIEETNLISRELGLKQISSVRELLNCPDIIIVERTVEDEDRVWNILESALEQAVNGFVEMRLREGSHLKDDILSQVEEIGKAVSFIDEHSPQLVAEYNEKLLQRMKAAIGDIPVDEQRLLTEAAIFADKTAVAEETVRLRSHIQQLTSILSSNEPAGRRLDFLVQEMNREANTIGSKAQDVTIVRSVIDIKARIEKIREQIQNIE